MTAGAPVPTEWAWIGLGSSLGWRGGALACLRGALEMAGVEIRLASSEILTEPVGVTAQGWFHNQVLLMRSREAWTPEHWLDLCLAAERRCGRRPTYRWGPRRADADLLLLGRHGELRSIDRPAVPHPELSLRPFLHRLVAEIDPAVAARISTRPSPPADPLGG